MTNAAQAPMVFSAVDQCSVGVRQRSTLLPLLSTVADVLRLVVGEGVRVVAVGALAALLPAWRAVRVDPVQALRSD